MSFADRVQERSRRIQVSAVLDDRKRRLSSQSGVTLVETLVTLAIMAIVVGPLTAGFIVMIRGSDTARKQLDDSADAVRIGSAWTADVQSVDPGGINAVQPCRALGATGGPVEVDLVTFKFNSNPTLSPDPESRATWVAVGTGTQMELHRRYCVGEDVVQDSTLATALGKPGQTASQAIHGPLPSPDQMVFCPAYDPNPLDGDPGTVSDTCTIVIEGAIQYRLSVKRRVAEDAGNVQQVPPPAPQIVAAATQPRNTYLTVGWVQPALGAGQSPIVKYRVLVFKDVDGNGPVAATVEVSGTAAEVHGLDNFVDYFVRVQAINANGMGGEPSATYGPVTPAPTAPDAPTITGTPVEGDTKIVLSWTPNSNNGGDDVTAWTITASSGSENPISVTVPHVGDQLDGQSGEIGGLTNGVAYTVTVNGINGDGPGLVSDSTGTLIPYGVPDRAFDVLATPQPDGTVVLSWSAPPSDGGRPITGYRVELDNGLAAGPWPTTGQFAASITTQTLTGLVLGEQYTFKVLAYNARGFSTSFPSNPPIVSAALPGAPTSVSAVASGAGKVVVTWAASAPNGSPISNYEVSTSPAVGASRDVGTALTTTYTGLNPGTSYTFYVRAKNSAGWGPSANSSASPVGGPNWQGQVPTLVRVTGNNYPFAFTISWPRPPKDGGLCINKYRVEYSKNGSSVDGSTELTSTPGPTCSGEPSRTHTWTGIAAGPTLHYFRVVAVNALGESEAATTAWTSISAMATCSMIAVEDAWVNASSTGSNYGTDQNLKVHKQGDQLFVKFDPRPNGSNCSQFGSPLPSSAKVYTGEIKMYNNDKTSYERKHGMFKVDAAWTEGSIKYNNKPTTSNYSVDQNAKNGGWRTWWLWAGDIEAQRTESTRFGWNVHDIGGNGLSSWAAYDSREKTNKPVLNITFY